MQSTVREIPQSRFGQRDECGTIFEAVVLPVHEFFVFHAIPRRFENLLPAPLHAALGEERVAWIRYRPEDVAKA